MIKVKVGCININLIDGAASFNIGTAINMQNTAYRVVQPRQPGGVPQLPEGPLVPERPIPPIEPEPPQRPVLPEGPLIPERPRRPRPVRPFRPTPHPRPRR
ncbi:hypothetical protein MK805_16570 [Shimazuella sp. AN120528]|uniref:hypothetical protein n=1 Tax=Shimazuella soli TaxID=1892854 RepID=UPI001F10C983|nr:hypothetical protein [Shimazuella soli]MCH5586554.1 hypothetical protein [Shimazuella soli]